MAIKSKKGSFKIGIYEAEIEVHILEVNEQVVPKCNELLAKHKEKEIDDDDSICDGYAIIMYENPLKIYILYSAENLSVNLITHETDHVREYIMEFKGIEDLEASANLNAYINQEVFRIIHKLGYEIKY